MTIEPIPVGVKNTSASRICNAVSTPPSTNMFFQVNCAGYDYLTIVGSTDNNATAATDINLFMNFADINGSRISGLSMATIRTATNLTGSTSTSFSVFQVSGLQSVYIIVRNNNTTNTLLLTADAYLK